MRSAKRALARVPAGLLARQGSQILRHHICTASKPSLRVAFAASPSRRPFDRGYATAQLSTAQDECASCNTPFQTEDESKVGFFVEPKKKNYNPDNDRFNALINSMSAETLEFLAREQNLVSGDAPFDAAEAKINYTQKIKTAPEAPRVCLRCHELRRNNIDEREPIIKSPKDALAKEEEVRQHNQEILDAISAQPDATVILTCSIHDFPANVPVFLKKRRNLRLVLTKAEGVVYVPQINSVNVQLWAASQMQSLGFKMAADRVHFFSAEHDKKGGYHKFSLYDLQRERNGFIVGYPNTGKTSLWNVLKEAKLTKESSELRYPLPKDKRALKKWKNVSWYPEHTVHPAIYQTGWGRITDMPAFKRVNSPWGLINPRNNSYVTDKMILTENGRKFAGKEIHLSRTQVALVSGLFGVGATPQSELMVWTSIAGDRGLAKHTNAAKANLICQESSDHERALHNLLDMGNPDLPQLVELGTVTFDMDDGVGIEVAFEGAGYARIKRTGRKENPPQATLWGFAGQVFAFRQPLCEIMLNNDENVRGFFGQKDPQWRSNRMPDFKYKVDFQPTKNVVQLGGPNSHMYRVKEGASTEFSEEQLWRARAIDRRGEGN